MTLAAQTPSTNDYAVTLRQAIVDKRTGLHATKIDDQIAEYALADKDLRQFLADEIGATCGCGGEPIPPADWKPFSSSASPAKFLEYGSCNVMISLGDFYVNPNMENWVRGRLASGYFNLEDALLTGQ